MSVLAHSTPLGSPPAALHRSLASVASLPPSVISEHTLPVPMHEIGAGVASAVVAAAGSSGGVAGSAPASPSLAFASSAASGAFLVPPHASKKAVPATTTRNVRMGIVPRKYHGRGLYPVSPVSPASSPESAVCTSPVESSGSMSGAPVPSHDEQS